MGYLTESVPSAKATENKKYQTWSKEIRIGDLTKRLQVEEVSNGFLITYSKYGREEGKEEYIDECVKKISTTNPFDKSDTKDDEADELDGLMTSAVNYGF